MLLKMKGICKSFEGISAIHQDMSIVNAMSVEDNIFLGREKTKGTIWIDRRSQQKETRAVLKQLGIQAQLSQLISECSMSVRQMIEIGKAAGDWIVEHLSGETRTSYSSVSTDFLTKVRYMLNKESYNNLQELFYG